MHAEHCLGGDFSYYIYDVVASTVETRGGGWGKEGFIYGGTTG